MELIKQNSKQRYYQLDFKIKKYKFGSSIKTIENLWKDDPIHFNDEYELAEDISSNIDKVCISDANTHIERLVFPCFKVKNKKTNEIIISHRNNLICGQWTMMIDGGDPNTIKEDKVYIRYLWLLQNV